MILTKFCFGPILHWSFSNENETKRLKTNVANRLALINEHIELSQWRYVNTDLNPADLFSRGLMPTLYQQCDSWVQGPGFLLGSEEIWPTRPFLLLPLDDDPDLKRDACIHATSITCADYFCDLFTCFFVYFKLLKVVAWVLRFKNNLPKRLDKSTLSVSYTPHLSSDKIE